MNLDPAVSLALSIQSHRGIYALLIGSGLSSGAGIPTGWKIVEDLCGRLAVASGERAPAQPAAWYRKKFERDPTYSELLDRLASTREERMLLLKEYFEPTAEDRQHGRKVPTKAHRAIARLVAKGYFRIIITTNFDPLMEQALEAEGVNPTVISTDDQVRGMMPEQHAGCVVLKVHGHYLDPRIRNSPAELAKYPAPLSRLLDRLIAEYGLTVCGWSVASDVALSSAISRSSTRRFSMYWMQHGDLTPEAAHIIRSRQAIVLPIAGADHAFTELEDRINAIEARALVDPTTPAIAVAQVKHYLDPPVQRIKLHDLFSRERDRVLERVAHLDGDLDRKAKPVDNYRNAITGLHDSCRSLAPMAAVIARWCDEEEWPILLKSINLLAREEQSSNRAWAQLKLYPASILLHSAGIGALAADRWRLLKALIEDTYSDYAGRHKYSAVKKLSAMITLDADVLNQEIREHGQRPRATPSSDVLAAYIEGALAGVLGADRTLPDLFDEFEMHLALHAAAENWNLRCRFLCHIGVDSPPLLQRFSENLNSYPFQRAFSEAGFFGGNLDHVKAAVEKVRQHAQNFRWS